MLRYQLQGLREACNRFLQLTGIVLSEPKSLMGPRVEGIDLYRPPPKRQAFLHPPQATSDVGRSGQDSGVLRLECKGPPEGGIGTDPVPLVPHQDRRQGRVCVGQVWVQRQSPLRR